MESVPESDQKCHDYSASRSSGRLGGCYRRPGWRGLLKPAGPGVVVPRFRGDVELAPLSAWPSEIVANDLVMCFILTADGWRGCAPPATTGRGTASVVPGSRATRSPTVEFSSVVLADAG